MRESHDVAFSGRDRSLANVHVVRQGQGPSVVLLHGVGMRSAIWDPQIVGLSTEYDVIAIDMLGHGQSSLPPADAVLDDYAQSVLAVLDALGVAKAHVIGHSMGALIALQFALDYPARTSSVVAMNAVFCRTPEQKAAVVARYESTRRQSGNLDWSATVERWFGKLDTDGARQAAERTMEVLQTIDTVGYERTYRVFALSDTAHQDRLGSLKVPALFITGEFDGNSTPTMSLAMAALAPDGQADVMMGARHMMSVTAPEEVNRRLRAFLTKLSPDQARQSFDTKEFRKALGGFPTGVTVVTALDENDTPRGFTANSFTSVSLDPPLILVCIAKAASSCPIFSKAGYFAVNVLANDQMDISSLFASKEPDRFSKGKWRRGKGGVPLLGGVTAWFECRQERLVEAGDHIILVGEVLRCGQTANAPLAYCKGAHVALSLDVDRLLSRVSGVRVGGIFEHDGSILLEKMPDGSIDLPWGQRLGDADQTGSLGGRLHQLGADISIGFIFAVFESAGRAGPVSSVVYRGSIQVPPRTGGVLVLCPFDSIPWSSIEDDAVKSMLHRYVEERRTDMFGIYMGDASRGLVQRLESAAPLS